MTKITKYYIREWSKYVSNKSKMKTDAILKIAKNRVISPTAPNPVWTQLNAYRKVL